MIQGTTPDAGKSNTSCAALLHWGRLPHPANSDHAERREKMINRLADTVENSLDIPRLLSVLQSG
jgi:cobyric acid synthase